ncbi:MAG: hypothetical protein ABI920_07445 [Casimicrobiaceae bacterium]
MKIESHLEKFRRMDDLLARLDPVADPELWIWTAMNSCTNLLNAALHRCGASAEADSFHTQTDGLYAVPDRRNGGFVDAIDPPGDVMHVGQPALAMPLPAAVERACAALRVIEDLREPYVRGSESVPTAAARDWHEAYRRCVAELREAASLQDSP